MIKQQKLKTHTHTHQIVLVKLDVIQKASTVNEI